MTIAPERPMLAACDCLTLACGHCACDRCEDCGGCSGGGACTDPCEPVQQAAKFYLGTHMSSWLWDRRLERLFRDTTFFVSYNRFIERVRPFEPALHTHCRDSGGFTHLKQNGRWTISAEEYVANNRRWDSQLGPALWIAPRDWMCEPWVIFGKNQHLKPSDPNYFHGTREARGVAPDVIEDPVADLDAAVAIHQRYTVDDYLELTRLAPELPIIPVLQGWTLEQYQRCADMYAAAGVDLAAQPVVGLGSVCRRQATSEIREIVEHFHAQGLRLHGFGVKTDGLGAYAGGLESADSMAGSAGARREKIQLFGCSTHINCANCPFWFYRWHQGIVRRHLAPAQLHEPRPDIEALTDAVIAAHLAHDEDGLTAARIDYELARAASPRHHGEFDAVLDNRVDAMVDALIDDVVAAYGDADQLAAARARYEQERDRCPIKLHDHLDARLEARLADLDGLTPAA